MGLTLQPLHPNELEEFVKVFWAAFEPLEADMILPMIYPQGLEPILMARLKGKISGEAGDDISAVCFCVKDTETGEMVGVSQWGVEHSPLQTKAEIDAAFVKANNKRNSGTPVPDMRDELGKACFRAMFYTGAELMAGTPHVTLSLLATRPGHQRRGVASLLLRHGFQKYDPLGLPTFVCAGMMGKPVYEHFGFEPVRQIPFDGRQYGGRSEGKHWCMIRPSQSRR